MVTVIRPTNRSTFRDLSGLVFGRLVVKQRSPSVMGKTRWHRFENFLEDMGERPAGMTLDRYPGNDGNYKKSNCRWATAKEQVNNRRQH